MNALTFDNNISLLTAFLQNTLFSLNIYIFIFPRRLTTRRIQKLIGEYNKTTRTERKKENITITTKGNKNKLKLILNFKYRNFYFIGYADKT